MRKVDSYQKRPGKSNSNEDSSAKKILGYKHMPLTYSTLFIVLCGSFAVHPLSAFGSKKDPKRRWLEAPSHSFFQRRLAGLLRDLRGEISTLGSFREGKFSCSKRTKKDCRPLVSLFCFKEYV